MNLWRELYREEVSRLEFAGKPELLEQIERADETQRDVWLEATRAELERVRKSLLSAMLQPQFAEVLRSTGWSQAQQEFRTLLRLEAALEGRDPERALGQNAPWILATG